MDLQEFEGIPLDDVKSQKRLKSKLRKAFKTRGFQEWIEIFQKIDDDLERRFLREKNHLLNKRRF